MIRVYDARTQNCPLPGIIYVDTCWLYDMYSNDPTYRPRGNDVFNYMQRFLRAEGIMAVSYKALEELEHAVKQGLDYHLTRPYQDGTLVPQGANVQALATQEYDRIVRELNANPSAVILEPEMGRSYFPLRDKLRQAFPMMTSSDLTHLVIAARNGINSIATQDQHFLNVNYINLFTSEEAVLKGAGNSVSATSPLISFNDFSNHIGNG